MKNKIVKSKIFFEQDFIESIAEVPVEQAKPWPSNEKLKVVGKPVPRIDAYDKVGGSALYTSDIKLPRMAYAKTLRSHLSNAKIKNINTKKAADLKGVYKILTYKNTPAIKWYYGTSQLFDPHLRYEGDEIACVAAESEAVAEEALKLIETELEELPFVLSADEAMKPNAHKVHEWGNLTRNQPGRYERGNVDEGFAGSDIIVEDTFTTQVVVHNPTETHCSVVHWDGDKLTVWDSTQGIFAVRDTVAESLGIPSSSVRVIKKYMGGGFGSKLETGKYTIMAALLSREIGRPVKIQLNRKEANLAVGNRPDSVQVLKAGVRKDGTLLALNHYSYGSVGAYPNGAACSWPLKTMYKCPNIKVEEYSVLTNSGRARAFRAPGHVQGTFALDSIIDEAAEKIGMDPLEFRLINYTDVDQVFNLPYTSKKLKDAYKKGAQLIGWNKRNKVPGSGKDRVKQGIGMASQIWWGGGGPPAETTLKLNNDGSINLSAGTQDLGTGTYTFMAQVAAEVLEIPMEKIKVTLGDTDTCPYCGSSGGSMTASSVAPAVRDAAEQMKSKLISAASAILEVPEADLKYVNAVIFSVREASKKITMPDVVRKMKERVLITTGFRNANLEGYAINTFGAQFAKVEVDTFTGKIKVIKIVAAHDVGRVLNQKTLENQFHGGIIQGLSYALMEERLVDDTTGKVLTTGFETYKIPTLMDIPEIEIVIVSEGDSLISSVGAKGAGEPAIIPTAAAIANAVYNAIGIRMKNLPMSADKVLNAIYKL